MSLSLKKLLTKKSLSISPSDDRVKAIKSKIARMGETYELGNASKVGHLYNPIPFPEFDDIPTQREAVYERLELMIDSLPVESGNRLLDIGCHTGFNCFIFEKLGYHCTGVEMHELSAGIARDTAALYNKPITFINAEVTPELVKQLGKMDVTLFLSTFQWVTLARGFESAVNLLRVVMENSQVMLFETSMGQEGKAKMPMLPDEHAVREMLAMQNIHKNVKCLGEVVAPGGIHHPRRFIFVTTNLAL